MPDRNSWAVSDTPEGVITTEDARLATGALVQAGPTAVSSRNGIRPGVGDPGRVAAATPTANKTVTVQPFQAFMRPSRGFGSYIQTVDEVQTLDLLTAAPPHPGDPRNDLIIVEQLDKYYGDDTNALRVRQVVGDPSGTPGDPTPDSDDYFLLARVRVPAGGTEVVVTDGMIDDLRPGWVVGLGGVAPFRGAAERDAAAAYHGLTGYRLDRDWLELNDGTSWRVPSIPVCLSVADIEATITAPYNGQLAFNLADGMIYRWNTQRWIGTIPTGGTTSTNSRGNREARYEVRAGQAQTFPQITDTRIAFPTAVYTTDDVSASNNNSVFTLNRGGLWQISVSQRLLPPGGASNYNCYLAIVDHPSNFSIRWANTMHFYGPTSFGTLSCSTENRFTAGTQVCAILWTSAGASRTHDLTWVNLNNISLTWLRP
jgi:hypothetical protein